MAKNKQKFESDDFDFDSDLDMPDFGFNEQPVVDDRNPTTKVAKAIATGAKDRAMDPSFIRKVVTSALPRGYGQAFDLADQSAGTLKDLYNTTAKELRPVVKDLKRTTAKLLPSVSNVLPSKVTERIKKWSETDPDSPMGAMSVDAQRDASLQMQLGDIFKYQAETDAQRNAEGEVKEQLKEGFEQTRHRDQLSQFDAMRVSLQQLANYKNKVESGYHRKSLELQFRHYFVAMDSLEEQKRFNAEAATSFKGILKNTGLPDFVKTRTVEYFKEVARNKFIDSLDEGLFAGRKNFVQNVGKNISDVIKGKVSKFAGDVRSGLGMADMVHDTTTNLAEMGMGGGSPRDAALEMGGNLLGGAVTDSMGGKLGNWLGRKFEGNERVKKIGNQLSYIAENPTQLASDWANRTPGTVDANGQESLIDRILPTWATDILRESINKATAFDTTVTSDKVTTMEDPVALNRQNSKSITEIIPGYLARIYQELQIIRSGDAKTELVDYDFTTNKFASSTVASSNVFKNLFSQGEKDSTRDGLKKLIDQIDPNKTLTPEQRKILGKQFLTLNSKNRTGNQENLGNRDSYTGESSRYADDFADLINEYFRDDATGYKKKQFAKEFGEQGRYINDSRKKIQDHVNVGNRDKLEDMGLLSTGSDRINIDRIFDYMVGDDYSGNGGPSGNPGGLLGGPGGGGPTPPRRVSRRRGGGPTPPTPTPGPRLNPNLPSNQLPSQPPPPPPIVIVDTPSPNGNLLTEPVVEDNDPAQPMATPRRVSRRRNEPEPVVVPTGRNKPKRESNQPPVIVPVEIPRPQPVIIHQPSANGNNDELIRAIRETSSLSASETINETLLRIEKKINEGIDLRNSGDPADPDSGSPRTGRWWNRSIAATGRKLWDGGVGLAKKAANFGNGLVTDVFSNAKKLGGMGLDAAKGAFSWIKGKSKEITDVYIQGELQPRLLAWKVKAGHYKDQITGEVIKKFEDIKGAIIDEQGNIIMTAEEAKKAFVNYSGGKKLISALGSVVKFGIGAVQQVGRNLGIFYGAAFGLGKKLLGMGKGWLDSPVDIYVRGKPEPVMIARTMTAGGYISRITKQPVTKPSMIDGVILDDQGNVVLTAEELAQGIFDKHGRPIRTGLNKLFGRAKDLALSAFKHVKNHVNWVKDKAVGAFTGMRDHFARKRVDENGNPVSGGILSGNSIFGGGMSSGNKTNKLLRQIRDMLNVRLPGEQSVFDETEVETTGPSGPGMVSRLKGAGKNLLASGKKVADGVTGVIGKGFNTSKELFKSSKVKVQNTLAANDEVMPTMRSKAGASLAALGGGALVMGGSVKDKIVEKATSIKDRVKNMFGTMAKKDGLQVSGMAGLTGIMTQIRDRLEPVKKKIIGDSDGDGIRNGSYADLLRRKKGQGPQLALGPDGKPIGGQQFGKSRSLLGSLGAGAKGIWDKLRGKKNDPDDEDEDDDDGLDIDMDGDSESRRDRRRRNARRSRRMRRPGFRQTRGIGGKAKWLAKAAGRGVGGAAKFAGRAGLGLLAGGGSLAGAGGMLASGAGALASGAGAVGSAALTGGAALAGGIGTAAAAAGSAIAGIAALITAPVLIGAAAIAAVGVGGYMLYKYMTKKKLTTLSKIRYAQYGFLPTDTNHLQAVFGLEDGLMEAVSYEGGKAKLTDKKIDLKKMIEAFDVNLEDTKQVDNWMVWFSGRFKPVFLTHLTGLKAANPQKNLEDIENLEVAEKRKYLNAVKFPEGPYNYMVSPFTDLKRLEAGANEVKGITELAVAELTKEETDAKTKGGTKAGMGIVLTEAGATAATVGATALATTAVTGSTQVPKLNSSIMADLTKQSTNADMPNMGGVLSVSGIQLDMSAAGGTVSALDSIRYKTYGLTEMVAEKVKALMSLERSVNKNITYNAKKVATWEGSVEKLVLAMGPTFGIEGLNNTHAYDWLSWFNSRFLPTYLNYLSALCAITNKTNETEALNSLKPQQKVDVAMVIYTTTAKQDSSTKSVWQMSTSPWVGFVLNSDVKSIDKNITGLKEAAKKSILNEEGGAKGASDLDNKKEGFFSSAATAAKEMASDAASWIGEKTGITTAAKKISEVSSDIGSKIANSDTGKAISNSASRIFNQAADAVGFDGGAQVAHPGNGSGGSINDLPMPTGNKSWAAMKDLIMGAAKMTGVDPKLMGTMAAIESGFDYKVKAGTSSATGLYQFIRDTWKIMLKKYGAKYGIDPSTSPTDPRANALMGAEFLKENMAALKGVVNRPLTDTDLYIAHFMGAGGARKFLKADPSTDAAALMPAAARANVGIFYKDGRSRTTGEVYAELNNRVRNKGKKFGVTDGSESIVTTPAAGAGTMATTSAPTASTPSNKPANPAGTSAVPLTMAETDKMSISQIKEEIAKGRALPTSTTPPVGKATVPADATANPSAVPTAIPTSIPSKATPVVAKSAPAPIPVSYQTPSIATTKVNVAADKAVVKPIASAPSNTPPPVSDGSRDLGAGFNMAPAFPQPRQQDMVLQKQFQKDMSVEVLNKVNTAVAESLTVQQDQLVVLKAIRAIMENAPKKTPTGGNIPEASDQGKIKAPIKPQAMSTPPVSMAKPTYG